MLHAAGQVYSFLRRLEDDLLVVVLNNGTATYHVDIAVDTHLRDNTHWRDLMGNGEAHVTGRHLTGLTLPPRSGAVLVEVDAVGAPLSTSLP